MREDKPMSSVGAIMATEIAKTPKVFRAMVDNKAAIDALKNVLIEEKFQSVLILARGFAYPNAREAALKIQETYKVSVQGLSSANYLHAPIGLSKVTLTN
jgi:glucosamine 6-phosphate synthetase-like amidotransferase/phosphosugar isomerase protein